VKVLFVCHRLPYPPKRGGKIRPFNVIRHLHRQGHEVTVASLARSPGEAEEGVGLRDHCADMLIETVTGMAATARMVARLPTLVPSSMGYFYSPRLMRRIRAKLHTTSFDLIFVHCSSVAGYVARASATAKVFDLGDIDSQKWLLYSRFRAWPLAAGYWLEGVKLERAERRLASNFDLCTCTTRAELKTFDNFNTGISSGWFPNGVDAEYFAPAPEGYDANIICFVGRMDYYPNQEAMQTFCRDVLPMIRVRHPMTRLRIVGANPSDGIIALGELPGVTVTGSVDDVRPYVQNTALTVAPLSIARGTQNKILESMAMGVPVVASVQAASGVDALPGEHLLVADTPQEYSDAILSLLEEPDKRAHFATSGRERVLCNHSWDSSMGRLDTLIESSLAKGRLKTGGNQRGIV
jgi:sugar transferase (PEP-CTERM/EpsH1 system associated)